MNKTDLQFLMNYNYWANARVLQAAARILPEQFTAPFPVSFGSLRGSLVHVLGAEIVWRQRIQSGVSPTGLVPEDDFPTLADLGARWAAEERTLHAIVDGLEDDGAAREIHYRNSRGIAMHNPLWQILSHVVNHGTQFRGEAAVILTQLGQSPGDLDMIYYIRSLGPGK